MAHEKKKAAADDPEAPRSVTLHLGALTDSDAEVADTLAPYSQGQLEQEATHLKTSYPEKASAIDELVNDLMEQVGEARDDGATVLMQPPLLPDAETLSSATEEGD